MKQVDLSRFTPHALSINRNNLLLSSFAQNVWTTGIFLLLFSLNVPAKEEGSKARWISTKIVIDGNDKEWEQPFNFYDDKSGLMYTIGNNNETLFLCFTMKEEQKMRKLMSAGWTIQLSSKEKKKKFKAELNFPGVNMMTFKKSDNPAERKTAAASVVQTYQLQMTTLTAKGFVSGVKEVKLKDPNGIDVAVGSGKNQHVVYEMAIPLKELFPSGRVSLSEPISLRVTVNALERPSFNGNAGVGRPSMGGGRTGGGMSGRGMSGMGSGGRGTGMGGGMGGNRQGGEMYQCGGNGARSNLFDKVSFKQEFSLTIN